MPWHMGTGLALLLFNIKGFMEHQLRQGHFVGAMGQDQSETTEHTIVQATEITKPPRTRMIRVTAASLSITVLAFLYSSF